MICAGCQRELQVGDRYIEDTASGFLKTDGEGEAVTDYLIGMVLGGGESKLRYCEACTQPGGDYMFETFYGEDL